MKRVLVIFVLMQFVIPVISQNNLVIFGTISDSITKTPVAAQEIYLQSFSSNTLIHFDDTIYSSSNGNYHQFYTIQNYISGDSAYILTRDVNNNLYQYAISLDQAAIETSIEIFTPLQNCHAAFHHYQDVNNINTIHFNDYSSGSILSRSWDFGDGYFSTSKDPSYTYTVQGIYQVSLTITCGNGNTNTQTRTVVVPSQTCQAQFNYSRDSLINQDLVYHFEDLTSAPNDQVTGWYWDIDQGISSYQQNPEIHFQNPGKYKVCLTTYTQYSCLSTYCDSIDVIAYPHHSFGGQVFKNSQTVDRINASLYRQMDQDWTEQTSLNFDTLGYFHFHNYPEAAYLVKAVLDPQESGYESYFPTYSGNHLFWQNANPFNNNNTVWNRDIQLTFVDQSIQISGNGQISGTILFTDQTAAINQEILLLDENSQPLKYTFTDALGYYEFDDLAIGEYFVYPEVCGVQTIPSRVEISSTISTFDQINFTLGSQIITGLKKQDENGETQIKIFPNPTSDILNISIENQNIDEYKIEVYDLSGRNLEGVIQIYETSNTDYIINMTNLTPGYYNLIIRNLKNNFKQSLKVLRK